MSVNLATLVVLILREHSVLSRGEWYLGLFPYGLWTEYRVLSQWRFMSNSASMLSVLPMRTNSLDHLYSPRLQQS